MTMPTAPAAQCTPPVENQLLACLPAPVRLAWNTRLEQVALSSGQVLHESKARVGHVYFPLTAVVSLLYDAAGGSSSEIAVVGNEGMVGFASLMGGDTTLSRAVVHSAGHSLRMDARFVKQEFDRVPPVMHLLLRYTQALITQMAQTAVCNRYHTLDEQLCRWLLLSLDRMPGRELHMTQALISSMLGVRREGVTENAAKLQRAGLISYARGRITVLDRIGLERRTCECYQVVSREYARLLPNRTAL
jgi:CRP-like cAMP-binding protein